MRGVNKLIIEIKDTDSEYFDRAILFLKPGKLGTGQSELNESADRLLREVDMLGVKRTRRILPIAAGAALLAAAILLLLFLCR